MRNLPKSLTSLNLPKYLISNEDLQLLPATLQALTCGMNENLDVSLLPPYLKHFCVMHDICHIGDAQWFGNIDWLIDGAKLPRSLEYFEGPLKISNDMRYYPASLRVIKPWRNDTNGVFFDQESLNALPKSVTDLWTELDPQCINPVFPMQIITLTVLQHAPLIFFPQSLTCLTLPHSHQRQIFDTCSSLKTLAVAIRYYEIGLHSILMWDTLPPSLTDLTFTSCFPTEWTPPPATETSARLSNLVNLQLDCVKFNMAHVKSLSPTLMTLIISSRSTKFDYDMICALPRSITRLEVGFDWVDTIVSPLSAIHPIFPPELRTLSLTGGIEGPKRFLTIEEVMLIPRSVTWLNLKLDTFNLLQVVPRFIIGALPSLLQELYIRDSLINTTDIDLLPRLRQLRCCWNRDGVQCRIPLGIDSPYYENFVTFEGYASAFVNPGFMYPDEPRSADLHWCVCSSLTAEKLIRLHKKTANPSLNCGSNSSKN
jgi:hypothetical protein